MICIDLERNKLSFEEGWRNFKEMHSTLEVEHKLAVKEKLIEKLTAEKKGS